jgi:hypothetical protein
MPNSKHLTHGISNLVSLITKTKLRLSLCQVSLAEYLLILRTLFPLVADGQMYYGYCINCLYPAMGEACNTPGVYHQLSGGFKIKHDRLSGDDNIKVNLWR